MYESVISEGRVCVGGGGALPCPPRPFHRVQALNMDTFLEKVH